jgi:hypothetical protein
MGIQFSAKLIHMKRRRPPKVIFQSTTCLPSYPKNRGLRIAFFYPPGAFKVIQMP